MPNDDHFRGLLSDYIKPIEDDGFADTLMAEIDAQDVQTKVTRHALLRRLALYGAGFVGGIIAAAQLPRLTGLFQDVDAPIPNLPIGEVSANMMSFNPGLIGVAALVGFVLWAALDQRAAELF